MNKMESLQSAEPERTPLLKKKYNALAPSKMPQTHDKKPESLSVGERFSQLNGMLIFLMV
jgi:hypothetical protein